MNLAHLTGEALLVHADELQAQGDVRGVLMAWQHRREREPPGRTARRLHARQVEWLEAHRVELMAPLRALSCPDVCWRLGFIEELAVEVQTAREFDELLEALRRPVLARLAHLNVTLSRGVDLSRLWSVLPATLRGLGLKLTRDTQWALEGIPRLRSLELVGGQTLDFEETSLPGVVELRLDLPFENLSLGVMPDLKWLTVRSWSWEGEDGLPELEVVRVEQGTEFVRGEGVPDLHLFRGGDAVVREGPGVAGEYAFVMTEAARAEVSAAVQALHLDTLSVAVAEVELASRSLLAVELRSSGSLEGGLSEFSRQLGGAHRVLEVAASASNHDAVARVVDSGGARCLAMGPFRDRVRVWREGVDQLFGSDPGTASWRAVRTRLDAQVPRVVRGEMDDEWPLMTPLPAAASALELDDHGEPEDEVEAPAGDFWEPAQTAREEEWTLDDAFEARAEQQAAAEFRVFDEGPIEVEEDGLEPNVTHWAMTNQSGETGWSWSTQILCVARRWSARRVDGCLRARGRVRAAVRRCARGAPRFANVRPGVPRVGRRRGRLSETLHSRCGGAKQFTWLQCPPIPPCRLHTVWLLVK